MTGDKGTNPTLTAAIGRVLSGDVESYEVIYYETERSLRSYIGRRYGHISDAFVDEVDIRTHEYVFSHLNRYDSDRGASFQTWVNWQSNNVAIQVKAEWLGLRKVRTEDERWVRVAGIINMDTTALEVVAGATAEPADAAWRRHLLWREYDALSNEGRLSVALHDIAGLTLPETAAALGVPESRLRRLLDKCHNRLRKRLTRAGVRPVECRPHFGMVRYEVNDTGYDEDWSAWQSTELPAEPDSPDEEAERSGEEGETEQ
jgi:DNA-directed RNA polymerase specialized sigma24 family protein